MDLLRYCCEGTSSWGVIHFGISVPMYLSYRKEVRKLPEEAWQKRLLATIYGTPATLTRHAKQMVLKIEGKIGKMLQEAHWKLFRFHCKLE